LPSSDFSVHIIYLQCWNHAPEAIIDSSDICGTSTLVTYYLNLIAIDRIMRIYAQKCLKCIGKLDIGPPETF